MTFNALDDLARREVYQIRAMDRAAASYWTTYTVVLICATGILAGVGLGVWVVIAGGLLSVMTAGFALAALWRLRTH